MSAPVASVGQPSPVAPAGGTRLRGRVRPLVVLLDAIAGLLLVLVLLGVSALDRRAPVAVTKAPRIDANAAGSHASASPGAGAEAESDALPPPPPPRIEPPPEPPAEPDPEPPTLADLGVPQAHLAEGKPAVAVQFSADLRFGLQALEGNPDDPTDDHKKLTYEIDGGTNNTRVLVDGATPFFWDSRGKVVEPLRAEADGRERCAWAFRNVEFTQTVQIVPGELSQRLDTILVTYTARNVGKTSRRVGLRVMLDTLIGDNDGVPFLVAGQEGIVEAPQSFHGGEVPDFIRALEANSLTNPGVIVSIGLATSAGERPTEVVLTHWPGSEANWDYNRAEAFGNDTAAGLYYATRRLDPGETRTFAFTYGLGTISSTRTRNARLSLTSGGPMQSGGKFWLVALVQNPKPGQAVSLHLPEGLTLRDPAEAKKPVPVAAAGRGVTQLSWLVNAEPACEGDVEVSATLEPEGVQERQTLFIKPRDAQLRLVARGPISAGRPFWVVGLVQHPRAAQTLELTLPRGLALAPGETASKELPAAGAHAQVRWLVRAEADAQGTREVSAKLAPEGLIASHTVTVEAREERITLATQGPFQSGRPFWVSALVDPARVGQALELTLPPGLVLEGHERARKQVSSAEPRCQVNWLVRARRGTMGKQPIAVTLQPAGREIRTEVDIEPGNLIR